MLEFIRARAQGIIAWLIVIAICLTFALWGVSNYLDASGGAGDVIVKVNGMRISNGDLQQAKKHVETILNSQFPGASQVVDPKKIRSQALNQLIDNALLNKAVYKRGFAVGQQQLLAAVAQLPELQDDSSGQFSEQKFQLFLSRSGYSLEQFLDILEQNVLLNQLQQGTLNSAFALEDEAKHAYALDNQTRNIEYTIIENKSFEKDVIVSNNNIKGYYQSHKSEFIVPEQVSIEYVQLNLQDLADKVVVPDDEVKQYYQDNKEMFTMPAQYQVAQLLIHVPDKSSKQEQDKAKQTIDEIADKATQGVDFTQLVKQYSDDVASAKQGGILPWFTLGNNTFDEKFEQTVAVLEKGQVSKPIRTSYGFNIIKLIDIKDAKTKPLSEIEKQIKSGLQRQHAEQSFVQSSNELANLSFENPDSLDTVAKALNLNIQSSDLFTEENGGKDITANPKIIEAAFSDDVLKDGNNSAVIELGEQNLVVLRIKVHKAASQKVLKQVTTNIKKILTEQAADKLASKEADDTVAVLELGNATKQNWQKATITRHSDKLNAEIIALSFDLNRPAKKPSVAKAKLKKGYAVVKLIQVNDIDISELKAKDYQAYLIQLEQGLGRTDYLLFNKGLRDQANIKYYNSKDSLN